MKLKKKISLLFVFFIIVNIIFSTHIFAATPNISSGAALSVEISTGKIIYEKNAYKKMYPASTTKIMTALLVLENCELTDKATVSYSALSAVPSGYAVANLQVGEQLTIEDLLYALLLKSANEAANVLAEHVAGSVESFSTMMNTRAEELGCKTTHFVNPNGVHDDEHYSSAYDLYLIANEAMKNSTFRAIVSTRNYTLPATDKYPNEDRSFSNTNQLIHVNNNNRADNYYYKYAIGIKTGYTTQARNCLVSAASRDGLEFINVILDAGLTDDGLSIRFLDSIELFDYAYDNYTLTKIKDANSFIKTIEIENGTKETKNLDLYIQDSVTVINNKNIDASTVLPEITLNENLIAPINKGDVVGKIKYIVDDTQYTSNLLAGSSVEEKSNISIFLIIAGSILLVFATTIMPKKKRKSKKRRYRR